MRQILNLVLILVSISTTAQEKIEFKLNFKGAKIGNITSEELVKETDSLEWSLLGDNASIVEDEARGEVLKIKYPKGCVGPSTIGFSGSQFLKSLTPANEYYLDYYVKFEKGFDFAKGGKLPGLTSGGGKYTGGNPPHKGEGWSTRYMWVDNGELILYFYFIDMVHKYGDVVKTEVTFKTGKWYRLTQRIRINQSELKDGILQVWVDGKEVINKQDVRFRVGDQGMIDSFYFSTFHGGATADWAPKNDSYSRFDKFTVSTSKPDFSIK